MSLNPLWEVNSPLEVSKNGTDSENEDALDEFDPKIRCIRCGLLLGSGSKFGEGDAGYALYWVDLERIEWVNNKNGQAGKMVHHRGIVCGWCADEIDLPEGQRILNAKGLINMSKKEIDDYLAGALEKRGIKYKGEKK